MSNISSKLAKLFNLPKHTRSFELKVEFEKPVIIKCEYYPEVNSLPIELCTAEFELVEKQ